MPDSWALVAAKNASFSGHFERPGIGAEMAPENEAPLTAIRGQKEGLPDGRRGGRDSPTASRKSWGNRCKLNVTEYLVLNDAKNASLSGHFERPDNVADMAPEMGHPYPRLGAGKRDPAIVNNRFVIPGLYGGVVGVLNDWFSRWVSVLTVGRSTHVRATPTAILRYCMCNCVTLTFEDLR